MNGTYKIPSALCQIINNTPKRPLILVIDGRAAAGKTTLANALQKEYTAEIISMDDFFLPMNLRTEERRNEPGGNVHYERFREEVLPFIGKGKDFSYGVFNCSEMDIDGTKLIAASDIIVVEGSYSHHPVFGDYADIKVFCDISPEEQLDRIKARNGEQKAEQFKSLWIPLEEKYFNSFDIKNKADIVICCK